MDTDTLSPTRLQINDDRIEKAERLKSRQALREIEVNEMRAAASPMRKQIHHRERDGSESPQTPRNADPRRRVAANNARAPNSPGSLNVVSHGATVTPVKRAPILANFEEWMKLATDNKINAANSWNFALIDYFHDMSLLKEGDGVNFQKASCTLDGCVKIYTSRVDSVSTEAGRLLSGLADSGNNDGKKKKRADGEEGEDGEGEEGDEEDEDGDGEDGAKKRARKKPARSHEATLAPTFASLQLKKLELEFAVDPLFKKASADFDEGGAKGLLLNHLSIDGVGRIVFDSSDDAGDVLLGGADKSAAEEKAPEETDEEQDSSLSRAAMASDEEAPPEMEPDAKIDLDALGSKFFPDLSILDAQDICPSMKSFKLGDLSGDFSLAFLKAPDDWKSPQKRHDEQSQTQSDRPKIDLNLADATGIFLDGTNAAGFDDDDDNDGLLGGLDLAADNVGFGEGGEAWAKDAALEPMLQVSNTDAPRSNEEEDEEGNEGPGYTFTMSKDYQADTDHANVLQYFDKAFNSKRGRAAWMKQAASASSAVEYWRIAKIQLQQQQSLQTSKPGDSGPKKRERKEKEPFEIDFLSAMSEDVKTLLAQPPATNASITLPRAHWRTKGRNLLEVGEGERIDSKMMGRLWLKPRCVIVRSKEGTVRVEDRREDRFSTAPEAEGASNEDEGRKGDYDANFFNDDDDNGGHGFDVPLPIDEDDDLADDGMGIQEEDNDSMGQAFMDAREMLSPPPPGAIGADGEVIAPDSQQQQQSQSQPDPFAPGSFGSQLVNGANGLGAAGMRKVRPEYVNYARVAKKVDVRRLKEELWKGMMKGFERASSSTSESRPATSDGKDSTAAERESGSDDSAGPGTPKDDDDGGDARDVEVMDLDHPLPIRQGQDEGGEEVKPELKFTDMMASLREVYPEQQMKDISTSYCFICLLHLANEKGLVLQGDLGMGSAREGVVDDEEEGALDNGGGGDDEKVRVKEREDGGMREILVWKDPSVGEGYEGE